MPHCVRKKFIHPSVQCWPFGGQGRSVCSICTQRTSHASKENKEKKKTVNTFLPFIDTFIFEFIFIFIFKRRISSYFDESPHVFSDISSTDSEDRHILARTVKVRGLEPPHAFVKKFCFLPPLADLKLVTYRVVVTSFGQDHFPAAAPSSLEDLRL